MSNGERCVLPKPQLLYLSTDGVQDGIGYSQVFGYLKHLTDTFEITLLSFEKKIPNINFKYEMEQLGIKWVYYPFKTTNFINLCERAFLILKNSYKVELIHARGNFTGFLATFSGAKKIVWDCRALIGIQRASVKPKSLRNFLEKLCWDFTERRCAKKATKIVTITERTIPYLSRKYSVPESKFCHISTNVDLSRFRLSPYPRTSDGLKFLLLGEMTTYYDLELFKTIVSELEKVVKVEVTWLTPHPDKVTAGRLGFKVIQTEDRKTLLEMISECHFGVSVLKSSLGISRVSISPTKNAEFLACGRPILLDLEQGDLGGRVEVEKIGVAISRGKSLTQIAFEILEISGDSSVASRCYRYAKDHYDLENEIEKLRRIYVES